MSIDVNVQNDLVIVTESSEDITVNVSNAAGPAGANGVGVPVGGTTGQVLKKFTNTDFDTYWAADASGLTSVGLSMPNAFAVSNSPLTSNGTIEVTGAGTADQYVRGDGQLANFPTNQGGGSSVNYYLNGSVNQGTFGGDTYYEMSKTPIIGAGTNFTRTNAQGNGYIASFITDAGDPALLNIPGGNWNLEFYFAASSSGSTPSFYAELYKVSSANVFTLIASGSTNPEGITNGTVVDQYFTSIPVPQTSLLATDRLAIRIFVTPSGRTITLHTEDNNLCEVLTTFSTGLNALNGLTSQVQYFATGTSGTDFAISSATDTHTFNLPTASGTNRGALSSADWTTFSGKISGTGATGQVAFWNGTNSQTGSNNLFWDAANSRLGIGTNAPTESLHVPGQIRFGNTTNGYFFNSNSITTYGNIFWGIQADRSFQITDHAFSSTYLRINRATGNTSLGSSADGGQRLQVYGDAFVRGSGATSATTALAVQNSGSSALLTILNNGATTINGTTTINSVLNVSNFFSISGGLNTSVISGGQTLEYQSGGSSQYRLYHNFTNSNTFNPTTGAIGHVFMGATFAPTSGTAQYFQLSITPTINQTGGANGITRGLYVNPTLTAAADWRSIEWSNNSGWGLYGAGTAENFLGGNLTISRNQNAQTNIQVSNTTIGTSSTSRITLNSDVTAGLGQLYKCSSGLPPYKIITASNFVIQNYTAGDIAILNDFATGTIKFAAGASSTAQMTLTAAGRLLLGTVSESTFLLDVNGTARVSGASTFGGNMTLSLNQNSNTSLTVSNTTTGTFAVSEVVLQSNTVASFGKTSSSYATFKTIVASDVYIYNAGAGDITMLNNFSSGNIKFTAGGSSTVYMTIKSNGSVRYQPMATPGTAQAGDVYYDSTSNKLRCYDGTTWNDLF